MIRVELGEEFKRRGTWRYVIKSLWRDGGELRRARFVVSRCWMLAVC